jgi:hypothetical protein
MLMSRSRLLPDLDGDRGSLGARAVAGAAHRRSTESIKTDGDPDMSGGRA